MDFSTFAKLAKPGDLIAVSHQDWKTVADIESQVVRIVTESEFSHVCVLFRSGDDPMVLEAVVPCVGLHSVSKYLKDGFYWIATPDKPMTDAERDYALSCLGDEYSKLEAIAGQLNWLDIAQDHFWQCSELTIAMRRLSGLQLGDKATPAAVVKAALSQGYDLKFVQKDKDGI